jgi:hypothetical protein
MLTIVGQCQDGAAHAEHNHPPRGVTAIGLFEPS